MPKAKPQTLNKSHQTEDEKADRESSEAAMMPTTQLDRHPPALLQKHKPAIATWQRLIGLYTEIEGTIITAFDADLLAKYCLLEEECTWLATKRAEVDANAIKINKALAKTSITQLGAENYIALLQQYTALTARFQGLDARLDGKRKLLHALAQSLYLTPRSRAGVSPTQKTKPKADDFGKAFD